MSTYSCSDHECKICFEGEGKRYCQCSLYICDVCIKRVPISNGTFTCPQCRRKVNAAVLQQSAVITNPLDVEQAAVEVSVTQPMINKKICFWFSATVFGLIIFLAMLFLLIHTIITENILNNKCGPRGNWKETLIQCQRFPKITACSDHTKLSFCATQEEKDTYDRKGGFENGVARIKQDFVYALIVHLVIMGFMAIIQLCYPYNNERFIRKIMIRTFAILWSIFVSLLNLIALISWFVLLSGGTPDITESRAYEAMAWIVFAYNIFVVGIYVKCMVE